MSSDHDTLAFHLETLNLPSNLERLIPRSMSPDPVEQEIMRIHRERYLFAAQFVRGKRVLDCACGTGYGSEILAQAGADFILGVDVSPEAVAYARSNYSAPAIEYRVSNGLEVQSDIPFDVVISLETIEHVNDVQAFVSHLVSLIRTGGVFVGSVPTTLSTDFNPYHRHDISASQFRLIAQSNGLIISEELKQVQKVSLGRLLALGRSSGRSYSIRKNLLLYYAAHPDSFIRRLWTTVLYGLRNDYLVLAGIKSQTGITARLGHLS